MKIIFLTLIYFLCSCKTFIKEFCLGGVTHVTWTHLNFLTISHCISTPEKFFTYIFGSKISFRYACHAVKMWVWFVVNRDNSIYGHYVSMRGHETFLVYTYWCILCMRQILCASVLDVFRYSCSRKIGFFFTQNGRKVLFISNQYDMTYSTIGNVL